MNMPEAIFSMARLNPAVEIDPVQVSQAIPAPSRFAPDRGDAPETFDRVLARAERKSESEPATGGERQVSEQSPVRAEKPAQEKGKRAEADENSASAANVGAAGNSPAGESPKTSAPPAEGGADATAATEAVSATDLKTAAVSAFADAVRQALTDSKLAALLGKGLGNVVIPDKTVVTPAGSGLPADQNQSVKPAATGLPFPGETGSTADSADIQSLIQQQRLVGRPVDLNPTADSSARDQSNSVRLEQFRITDSSAQPVRSEWTEALDVGGLLNPTDDGESAPEPPPRQPVKAAPDRPFDSRRPAAETPRDPAPSRFNTRETGESTQKLVDSKLWFPGTRTDVEGQASVLREAAGSIYQAFRPQIGVSPEASPVAAAANPEAPIQLGRPMDALHYLGSRLTIDPEVLLSDVRQAVMRITADGRGQARIVLHPPELGELVVRLESARNGIVRAEFHTMSPLVREALEAGLSKLTQALEAEGLTLAQAQVHLSFHFGPEGNPGQHEPSSDSEDSSRIGIDERSAFDSSGGPAQFVERLPEGSTISILA